jgi:hypothetical protein
MPKDKRGAGSSEAIAGIKKSYVMRPPPPTEVDPELLRQERVQSLRAKESRDLQDRAWAKAKEDAEQMKMESLKKRQDEAERLLKEQAQERACLQDQDKDKDQDQDQGGAPTKKESVREILGKKKKSVKVSAGTGGGSAGNSVDQKAALQLESDRKAR